MNIYTILGNRCTYFRQKVLFNELDKHPNINLTLILTGSLLTEEYKDVLYEIESTYNVRLIKLNNYESTFESMAKSSAYIQEECVNILKEGDANICLALGDRWEQLPFATASAYLNIHLAHIQGGEISGNIDDKVRNAISALSDTHFPTHKYAKDKLTSFGYKNVFNYGCPSIDLIEESNLVKNNKVQPYFIVLFHPHTKEIADLSTQLNVLVEAVKIYINRTGYKCYWFKGNDDPGSKELSMNHTNVEFVTNLTGVDYLNLLNNSKFILGNSSSGIREASYLGIPAINLGYRQDNRVKASNVVTVKQFCSHIICSFMENISKTNTSNLFGNGNASKRIVKKLLEVV